MSTNKSTLMNSTSSSKFPVVFKYSIEILVSFCSDLTQTRFLDEDEDFNENGAKMSYFKERLLAI